MKAMFGRVDVNLFDLVLNPIFFHNHLDECLLKRSALSRRERVAIVETMILVVVHVDPQQTRPLARSTCSSLSAATVETNALRFDATRHDATRLDAHARIVSSLSDRRRRRLSD